MVRFVHIMPTTNIVNSFSTEQRPVPAVLSGAFMISFSAVWVALAGVEPTTSAFYRVFFGTVFLLIAAIVSGEIALLRRRHLMPYAGCGLAFALDLYFWHTSILFIGPGLATILGNFQVFLMAACGVLFFGERLKLRLLVSLPLAITGLLLVVGVNWSSLPPNYRTGIIFGLATALCYTVFLLSLRKIQATRDTSTRFLPLMAVSFFSALFLGLLLLGSGKSFAIPTVASGLSLVSLGLFSQAVGWILIATAMPHIRPSFTGLVLLLQPSLSFIWDVLFFARPTTGQHWLGVVITLAAIYLGLTGSRRA